MKRLLSWLSRRRFPYEPLIGVNISRSRLIHNLHEFQRQAHNTSIVPVLKSNAYGHGLLEIAKILEPLPHIPFFVVDSYFEAVALRAEKIRKPLLVIGYNRPETIAHSSLKQVAFAVTSIETLRHFSLGTKPCPEGQNGSYHSPCSIPFFRQIPIHLKIDTGMHRQGIRPEEIGEALDIIKGNNGLILQGICTHFSDADNPDESFTEGQIHVWNKLVKKFAVDFPNLPYVHAAATDGSRFSKEIASNVTRLGLGLYGLTDNEELNQKLDLRPVLEMETIVTGTRKMATDETVGYGNSYRFSKPALIATIPTGYFEGLDRRLSSGPENQPRGYVLVGPERLPCPIVGRISMNIATIDVTARPDTKAGDRVVIISDNSNDRNSIRSIARICGTIPYEIAVHVPAHLKRKVW